MARFHPTAIVFVPLILALIVAVACGGATAPTPRAAAPTAVTQQEQPTPPTAVTQQEQPTPSNCGHPARTTDASN